MEPLENAVAAIGVLRAQAERRYPGAVYNVPMFDAVATFCGFGVHHGTGLLIAYADTTSANINDQWGIQISNCLAIDIPDLWQVANWVNDRNRNTAIGRYYYGVGQADGLGALFYDDYINSQFINLALQGGQSGMQLWRLLIGILFNAIDSGSIDCASITESLGGRGIEPSEDAFILVFKSTSGG